MFKRIKRKKIKRFSPPPDFLADNFSNFRLPPETRQGIIIIFLFTLGIVSFLSLIDLAGALGDYLNYFLTLLFGITRWYAPFIFFILGYFLIKPQTAEKTIGPSNYTGLFLFILAFDGLIHLIGYSEDLAVAAKSGLGGGYAGIILSLPFSKIMGFWAALVVLAALALIGIFLTFNASFNYFISQYVGLKNFILKIRVKLAEKKKEKTFSEFKPTFEEKTVDFSRKEISDNGQKLQKEVGGKAEQLALIPPKFRTSSKVDLPLDLLESKASLPTSGDIVANQYTIKKTLENFGIPVEMGEVNVGPTVTQYTLKPAEGIKLSKITTLNNDLALALAAHPIRIEAPIPGRSLVGIEVPNQTAAIVPLKDILASPEFKKRKSNLTIALGKDVKGQPWLADISRMPHLLIAGATGSGKSVCINSIIISLLYQNSPADLKLILIDPKRVELLIYNDIPHLLTPVVCEVKKTINALRWAISEMERRLELLSKIHQRNIEAYNQVSDEKIPYIVIIIDELADLMAAAGAEIEAAVVRLAQMARAVGIHLIVSTQRPSVDVLTGLIKANITSRLAFSVASLVDSRTILDMSGAEKLLGRGDLLYIAAELSKPKRLQGAIVTDAEIKKVVDYLKKTAEPDYTAEVVAKPKILETDWPGFEGDDDPLLPEAKTVIKQAGKASASLLQRRLRIGYARAARILDLLEEKGFIGPADGAKPREILVEEEKGEVIGIEEENSNNEN